jgi:hypothetical protein
LPEQLRLGESEATGLRLEPRPWTTELPALYSERYEIAQMRAHKINGSIAKINNELEMKSQLQDYISSLQTQLNRLTTKYFLLPIKSQLSNGTIVTVPKLAIRDGLDSKPSNFTRCAIIGDEGWLPDVTYSTILKVSDSTPELVYEIEGIESDPLGNMMIRNVTCLKLKLENTTIPDGLSTDLALVWEKD